MYLTEESHLSIRALRFQPCNPVSPARRVILTGKTQRRLRGDDSQHRVIENLFEGRHSGAQDSWLPRLPVAYTDIWPC